MTYAYFRQLPNLYSLSKQQKNIISYSLLLGFKIDKEVLEYSNVTQQIDQRQEFEDFLHTLKNGDIVIVQNLSILSRYPDEVIKIIKCMFSHGTDLYIADSHTLIDENIPALRLLPLLSALSDEEIGKNSKKGRPKGSHSSSIFDKFQSSIIFMLKDGLNVSAISRELKVSRSSLKDYIESRELKQIAKRIWDEHDSSDIIDKKDNSKLLLICPFEKQHYKEIA